MTSNVSTETEQYAHTGAPASKSGSDQAGFVAGTLVHTKNGLVAIEKIRPGDMVLSRQQKGGDLAYQPVTRVYKYADKPVYLVDYLPGIKNYVYDVPSDAQLDIFHPFWAKHREFVVCTKNHPMFVVGKGWLPVEDLYGLSIRLELKDGEGAFLIGRYGVRPSTNINQGFAASPGGGKGFLLNMSEGVIDIVSMQYFPELDDSFVSYDYRLQDVYDLEVENTHTYFVGKSGLWVLGAHTV